MFLFPNPGMFHKFIAGKLRFFNAFGFQFGNHFCFGSNAGMVGTGNPTGIFTLHPGTTNKYILNGIVKHMPHVQHTGYIGWRNYNGVRFALIGSRFKKSIIHPVFIPFVLSTCGIIRCCNFLFTHYIPIS
jgi:hypothetical protein